jgi:hypothetical protein
LKNIPNIASNIIPSTLATSGFDRRLIVSFSIIKLPVINIIELMMPPNKVNLL